MRLQQYLQEKYYGRIEDTLLSSGSFEVFVNPSPKELNKELAVDIVDFIADGRKKKIYMWSDRGPFHDDAWNQINGTSLKSDIIRGNIIAGYAEKKGSKFVMIGGDGDHFTDDYTRRIDMVKFRKNWDWVNNYVDITEYFGKNV